MPKQSSTRFSLTAKLSRVAAQFKNLNTSDPASWPAAPRLALCASVVAGVVLVLWLVLLSSYSEELEAEVAQESVLKNDYSKKLAQAINLETLRAQREQVLQYVTQLEKQLPGKSEMDALLSDINQAGLGRSLSFELFRPGQVTVREYYAELPIALRVTGRYHDMGAFVSDVANLSRIVTLNNLTLSPGRDNNLTLEATAKTFRYLDPDEVSAQRKAAGGRK